MRVAVRLIRDRRAASAVEFALVSPLLFLLLLGIIDVGRFMWEYNRAEKATQMGARLAVVTDPVLNGLYGYSFSITGGIAQGTAVPAANFTSATCNNSTCSCVATSGGFCGTTSFNSTAFTSLVTRMHSMYPAINAANVRVDYKNVGLGFAGNPDGPDVSPLVTVRLTGLNFHPITCFVFACSMAMPSFSSALTLEDASGSVGN
jgi:Flp pilus assembly protein TadG